MKKVIEIKITTVEADNVLEVLTQAIEDPKSDIHESVAWFNDRLAIALSAIEPEPEAD